jgi:hypothetical protein
MLQVLIGADVRARRGGPAPLSSGTLTVQLLNHSAWEDRAELVAAGESVPFEEWLGLVERAGMPIHAMPVGAITGGPYDGGRVLVVYAPDRYYFAVPREGLERLGDKVIGP